MAESCDSVVSSAVTSVVSYEQGNVPESPSPDDASAPGSSVDECTKNVVTCESVENEQTRTQSNGDTEVATRCKQLSCHTYYVHGVLHTSEVRRIMEKSTKMSFPILAEESTLTHMAPSLEGIIKDLDETSTHHDYLVALLIVFLAESNFYVSSAANVSERCSNKKGVYIPKDWKSKDTGVYEIRFRLRALPDVECKLVAISSGDTIILNFFPLTEEREVYSIAVQSLKYINPFSSDIYGRYINIKELSHRFKDKVVTPVRSNVLIKAGIICPCLGGLPMELKLKILGKLDAYSLTRIAQCSSEFRELCLEPQLWKDLIRQDYPRRLHESIKDYRNHYLRIRTGEQRKKSLSFMKFPSVFSMYDF